MGNDSIFKQWNTLSFSVSKSKSKIHPNGPDLDGFSTGRYEKNRESFYLYAAKFESGAMQLWGRGGGGGKLPRRLNPFKTWFPPLSFYCKQQSSANSSSLKTAFEAKVRLYATGKVIQRLFIIDLYTQLAIYGYR